MVGLFLYNKKIFKKWIIFFSIAYVLLKYFKSTEHLTTEETVNRLTQVDKDIAYLKSVGLTETSDNDTMKNLVAEREKLQKSVPPKSSTVVTPTVTPTVTPKVDNKKPEPWSLCNIEKRGVI